MKNVIICEGFNDGLFITQLFKKLGFKEDEVKIFDQKDVTLRKKKDDESLVLRNFESKSIYNPKKFLIKLEGGKDSATKILCRELIYCLEKMDDLILLLDADHTDVVKKANIILDKIKTSYYISTPLRLNEEVKKRNEHLYHSVVQVNLIKNEVDIGKFKIVLFSKSLEHSCNIKKGHTEEEKKELISSFIEKEKIAEFFSEIIR